ncbi:tripartite tricarboxylate transporter substrate binding protein [Polaromonas glacialis]|uniref:tripartite tricarboxylate transporter substrate binding protein n=1 Tax=Polaromonas glacialis TaxID=866564 RepID=UPI000496CEA0|nr:tripartite tricarboxylate transporter substrate binding protein [Polaromonas glacialis]
MKKSMLKLAAATLAGALLSATAAAQSPAAFPSRTVTLVVPFTPSSGSDIIARIIAPKLAARWGQAVIVDNKPGASGNLGTQAVAKATPDGHTLLMAINTFTMAPAIYKNVNYDPVADFAPVTQLAETGFAFVVNPSVPAKDMKSLMELVKKSGGKINYASPGNGTPHHLAMELFKSRRQLAMLHVPYKGIQGALTDLMGGQVQMMFATVHSTRPLEQAGKLRFIAVTGEGRNPIAPEVPTFKEQGINELEGIDAWYAVLAPGRTPPNTIARLNRDIAKVMNSADIKADLAAKGLVVKTSTPAQLASVIRGDLVRWEKVVVDAHITAD